MSDFILAELLRTNRAILGSNLDQERLLRKILQVEQASMGYLAQIVSDLNPPLITGFTEITETTMVLLQAGQTATFATTPLPSTSVPDPAKLAWSSSDPVAFPLTPNAADPNGLSILLTFPASTLGGVTFSLTLSYVNADGTPASQTNSFTTVAPAPADVTGFAPITQVA